jgi:hypothetical protein
MPPVVISDKLVVNVSHTESVPVIGAGCVLTVTTIDAAQVPIA